MDETSRMSAMAPGALAVWHDPRNGYAVGEYLQLGAPREVGGAA